MCVPRQPVNLHYILHSFLWGQNNITNMFCFLFLLIWVWGEKSDMKYEMMRFQFSHRIVKTPRGQRALSERHWHGEATSDPFHTTGLFKTVKKQLLWKSKLFLQTETFFVVHHVNMDAYGQTQVDWAASFGTFTVSLLTNRSSDLGLCVFSVQPRRTRTKKTISVLHCTRRWRSEGSRSGWSGVQPAASTGRHAAPTVLSATTVSRCVRLFTFSHLFFTWTASECCTLR